MAFMRVLQVAIISGILFAGCEKKPQHAIHPRTEPPKAAAVKDTGKAFGKYYTDTTGTSAAVDTGKTFSMKKPVEQPPVAVKAKEPVEKPVIEKTPVSVRGTPEFSANGNFVVQVACAATSDDADAIAGKFKQKGYPVYVLEVSNPASGMEGTYYRVRIGSFRSRANAIAFGEQYVKPENYDFWVDYKSNETTVSSPASVTTANPVEIKPPVSSTGNRPPVPASAKKAAFDTHIWDTASNLGAPAIKAPVAPKPVRKPGQTLKVDSSKGSVMQSPLDLLLKVYDTGSPKKSVPPVKKIDSASMLPTFTPPAAVGSEQLKSSAGSQGNK